jgi:hypothetical protein
MPLITQLARVYVSIRSPSEGKSRECQQMVSDYSFVDCGSLLPL